MLFLLDKFDFKSITTIQLYNLTFKDKKMLTQLVDFKASYNKVINILKLKDKSFKLSILTTYIPELEVLLNTKLFKYLVNWKYQPFNFKLKDIKSFYITHLKLSNNYAKAKA